MSHHAQCPSRTWEVNSGVNRCACCNRGVDQVWILQPEPSSERTWVRATKGHPLAVCQPPGLCHNSAEVSQVSQRLATAEEMQVVCAEVPRMTKEAIETGSQFMIKILALVLGCHLVVAKLNVYRLVHTRTSD